MWSISVLLLEEGSGGAGEDFVSAVDHAATRRLSVAAERRTVAPTLAVCVRVCKVGK